MTSTAPTTDLDARYSDPEADPVAWDTAWERLTQAELFWLTTVRPDGGPHVTPLIAVWFDGAGYFCTGPEERKAKNLDTNSQVVLTTGTNTLREGLDLVVEGDAVVVRDPDRLKRVADAYFEKYGSDWRFQVTDGGFVHEAGRAHVYEVRPVTVYGFAKGTYGQTRWRFG
jgi:nitroimidazol reductase NimA-like FMN-containing flavoprotein (pyridoxamine 5'-phosphate oxidase superfamily)